MAAGGYDISASRSESHAQAANQTAGTVINFGAGAYTDGGWYGQEAAPNATAVAARNAGDTQGAAETSGFVSAATQGGPNWLLIAGIGLAGVAIVATVFLIARK